MRLCTLVVDQQHPTELISLAATAQCLNKPPIETTVQASVVEPSNRSNSGCSGMQPQGTSSKRYWAYRESEQRRGCAPEQPPSGSSPKAAPQRCCS